MVALHWWWWHHARRLLRPLLDHESGLDSGREEPRRSRRVCLACLVWTSLICLPSKCTHAPFLPQAPRHQICATLETTTVSSNDKEPSHPPSVYLSWLISFQSLLSSYYYGAPKRQRALNTCPPRVPPISTTDSSLRIVLAAVVDSLFIVTAWYATLLGNCFFNLAHSSALDLTSISKLWLCRPKNS